MRAVVQAWPSADVAIVLPLETVRAMFERARRFDVERGGRFDTRGAAVLLWSTSDDNGSGEPVGCFYVRWCDPDERHATIWRLEWDPAQGGSQDEVRRAIAVLGGPPA
jgi:hypothetical protein